MIQMLLVVTSLPDLPSALNMADRLVELKVAACVSCLPGVKSVYRWQGKTEHADEVTLLIKTRRDRYADLENEIVKSHPYEVPEIIALQVEAGLPAYLEWVAAESVTDEQ